MARGAASVRALPAMLLVGLAACGPSFPPLDPAALPRAEAWPGEPAIILERSTVVELEPDESARDAPMAVTTTWRRLLVLSPAGEAWAEPAVEFKPGHSEVLALEARVVPPGESARHYRKGDARERPSYPEWILYADQRRLELDLRPARPGTVIELRTVVRHRRAAFSQFDAVFGAPIPVLHDRFEVRHPGGWSMDWRVTRGGQTLDWEPVESRKPPRRSLTWEDRDLPAYRAEPLGPPWSWQATRVAVRLARWQEGNEPRRALPGPRALSAQGWRELNAGGAPAAELRRLSGELLEGMPEDSALRARRLFEWVRDRVRYCAVEVGDGALRAHPARTVLEVGYGDCKDKANLLHGLLAAAGIQSRPALIFAHDGWPQPFGLPATNGNFNHMILVIDLPGGRVAVDPTADHVPFGHLPLADQETALLPLDPRGEPLMLTPGSRPEDNARQLALELRLDGSGDAVGRFVHTARGAFADALRARLRGLSPAEQAAALEPLLGMERAALGDVQARPEDPDGANRVELRGTASLPRVAPGTRRTRVLRPSDFLQPLVPPLPEGARRSPVVLPSRSTVEDRVRVRLPPGWQAGWLPEPERVESPFGRFRIAWQAGEGAVSLERTFVQARRVVPPEEYPALRDFFERVAAAERRAVLLEAHPSRSARHGGDP